MCGIFAAVKLEGSFDQDEVDGFKGACDIIAHRGPDSEGYFMAHTRNEDEGINLFLGHRRLAIIDLDAASNQPFVRDGLSMVYNGEVFNFLELRNGPLAGMPFDTQSDTEVILRAYQKWGAGCFGHFNGMWALVIHDPARGKLIMARDRFSIKPLYTMRKDGAIYFASELKQFKQLKGVKLTPNRAVISAFLNQGLLDHRPETFYNEIDRFPAMHCLEIDLASGDEKWTQYWDYSTSNTLEVGKNPITTFKSLLLDALKLRLRSDVPVGTLLSGGLDSSAISCLIHSHIDPGLSTFSVVSDSKEHSEERYVDILIAQNGLKNQKLRFDHSLAFDHIDRVLEIQDEPFGSLAVVAQYLLFQKIKNETGITVLLSGQGADEVLLGYNKFFYFHLKSLLRQGRIGAFTKLAGSSFIKGTTITEFNFREAKRYLPGSARKGQDYFTSTFESEALWTFDDMRSRQILDLARLSIPALTHYEDRNSMAASIEVRLPFLDYRLVDFLVNLPVEYKLKNGWTKHILREAVSEMPKEIRWRRDKKGFTTPEEEWMKGELGQYIMDYMNAHHMLEDMGIINKARFVAAVSNFRKGHAWLSHGDLFRVFIAEKWLNENL